MNIRPTAWLLLLTFALIACGPDYSYKKNISIPSGNWTYADSLDFSFQIEDTLGIYNLWLEVEHSVNYSFQNLYTRISTRFPSGEQLQEPLSLELADKIGRWYGDCNSSYCTLLIPIQKGAFFNQAGTYQITIQQYMRQEVVSGIRKIGFLLEQTHQSR